MNKFINVIENGESNLSLAQKKQIRLLLSLLLTEIIEKAETAEQEFGFGRFTAGEGA